MLVDISSYFIEQNNGLVLARLRERDSEGRRFEIKFYTHSPQELLSRYEDKIYIGRDFLDLFSPDRKYFGVKDTIVSLKAQFERLSERAGAKLKKAQDFGSYFQEIGDSVNELHNEGLLILQSLPPHLDFAKLSGKDLIDINAQYRTINHYVIELHDTVAEFENLLRFKERSDFVRYVTKYKKDVTNLISYFNIKINGVIGPAHPRLPGETRLIRAGLFEDMSSLSFLLGISPGSDPGAPGRERRSDPEPASADPGNPRRDLRGISRRLASDSTERAANTKGLASQTCRRLKLRSLVPSGGFTSK